MLSESELAQNNFKYKEKYCVYSLKTNCIWEWRDNGEILYNLLKDNLKDHTCQTQGLKKYLIKYVQQVFFFVNL